MLTSNCNRRKYTVQLSSNILSSSHQTKIEPFLPQKLSGYSSHSNDFPRQLTSVFFFYSADCDALNFPSIFYSMGGPSMNRSPRNSFSNTSVLELYCSSKIVPIPSIPAHWISVLFVFSGLSNFLTCS